MQIAIVGRVDRGLRPLFKLGRPLQQEVGVLNV